MRSKSFFLFIFLAWGISVHANPPKQSVTTYLENIFHRLPDSGRVKLDIDFYPDEKDLLEASFYYYRQTIVLSSQWLLHFSYEDEIAYILAHELSHGLLGHKVVSDFESSQNNELAADELALKILASSGYNPCRSISAFKKSRWFAYGLGSFMEFTYKETTHPRFDRRIKKIKKLIEKSKVSCGQSTRIPKNIRLFVREINQEFE